MPPSKSKSKEVPEFFKASEPGSKETAASGSDGASKKKAAVASKGLAAKTPEKGAVRKASEPKTLATYMRKPVMKILCRRAGVKTASGQTYDVMREGSSKMLDLILEKAVILMKLQSEKKRTLTSKIVRDAIEKATEKKGHCVLGFKDK